MMSSARRPLAAGNLVTVPDIRAELGCPARRGHVPHRRH